MYLFARLDYLRSSDPLMAAPCALSSPVRRGRRGWVYVSIFPGRPF